MNDSDLPPEAKQKLADYALAKEMVKKTGYDDIHFFLLLIEYRRLPAEERLAKGLARGRRKYFLVRS